MVESFENRLKWVICEKGNSISQILRNGIHQTPQFKGIDNQIKTLDLNDIIEFMDPNINDEPIEFMTKRPYTIEENIILLQLAQQFGTGGPKWKMMERYFANRTATSLRMHYNKITKKIIKILQYDKIRQKFSQNIFIIMIII